METQLWNCLNIKTKDGWVLANDQKGERFSSIDDPRFEKMFTLAEQFKHMIVLESTYNGRYHVSYVRYQQCFKCDFNRRCFISKTAFKSWFSCKLPGNFQSDRLEEELGICRQSSGECYYILNMLLCYYVSNCTMS